MTITYANLKPRYNKIGEWKPLIFMGDSEVLKKEIQEETKEENDKRIYGALFYIKATSCNSIEFIVKTHFKIPSDFQQIGSQFGKIQLHKLDFSGYDNLANIQIYDGTLELTEIDVDAIKNGLSFIDVTLHRLAFRLDTKVEWFIKYPHNNDDPDSIIDLTEEHVQLLGEYLTENLKGHDSIIFDMAISWYMNGNNSNNPFVSFLSYCIAMESLVDKFRNGKMEICAKYGVKKPKKIETDLLNCIQIKHDQLYATDPKQFIEEAYFDCIGSIQKKLRQTIEIVFGIDHEHIKLFFDKKGGYSLYDLRSKLAHGSFASLDSEHVELIKKRLPDIKHIAYQFILRLSTATLKNEKPKNINSSRSFSILFSSPKGTGVTNTLNMFPNKDWRIKPEWLF